MGTDQVTSEHHDQHEIQGLICEDVLRDWLRHLEHDAEDGQRAAMTAVERQDDDTRQ